MQQHANSVARGLPQSVFVKKATSEKRLTWPVIENNFHFLKIMQINRRFISVFLFTAIL
jgi:hypothetical protein